MLVEEVAGFLGFFDKEDRLPAPYLTTLEHNRNILTMGC